MHLLKYKKYYLLVYNRNMQKQKSWWFWQWFFLLTWGVIWAWFFTLPQAVNEAWITSSILIMCCVWILVTIMHLILWEVSLSLPGHKTFVWMSRSLFPHWLSQATQYINIINNMIWIIAYIMLWWAFIQIILWLFHIDIHPVRGMFIYFAIIWYFWVITTKSLNKRDTFIVIILLSGIWIILWSSWILWWDIYSPTTSFFNNFKVYGITLFALSSINAIPLLYHTTWSSAIKMREVILTSWFTVTIVAILFSVAIISISGNQISDDSIHGLFTSWYKILAFIWSLVWLTAMISSHIPLLEHLNEVFSRDVSMSPLATWMTVTLLPFIIILYFDIGLVSLLGIAWSLLGWLLFILVCLLNIYLHTSHEKVTIIPMIKYDYIWSWILLILCSLWVLYQILSFY